MDLITANDSAAGSRKLFLGTYTSALDPNNRLSMPQAFRAEDSQDLYMTQGFDRNLLALTSDAFQQVYRTVRSLNMADPLARLLLRLILGSAHLVRADKEGIITVPSELKDFAALGSSVLIVGQGDYFEIWSSELWKNEVNQLNDAEANSSRFSALAVATR